MTGRPLSEILGVPDREYLTPVEVADLFQVGVGTVREWARKGQLSYVRTVGGHRRYQADQVRDFLNAKRAGK